MSNDYVLYPIIESQDCPCPPKELLLEQDAMGTDRHEYNLSTNAYGHTYIYLYVYLYLGVGSWLKTPITIFLSF